MLSTLQHVSFHFLQPKCHLRVFPDEKKGYIELSSKEVCSRSSQVSWSQDTMRSKLSDGRTGERDYVFWLCKISIKAILSW